MTSIAGSVPLDLYGVDYTNAGHHRPSSSSAEGMQQWPGSYCGPSNPEQVNFILSDLAWQTVDWGLSRDVHIPQHAACSNSTNTTAWYGNQDQITPGCYYDPSTTPSAASDDTSSSPSLSQPTQPSPTTTITRKPRQRRKSSAAVEGTKPKRQQRRPKPPQDEEASRARAREKNRIAADKCRGRQRVAIRQLSFKHDSLEDQNRRLSRTLSDLVAERIVLKNMLVQQGNCGCELIENYLKDAAATWVRSVEGPSGNGEVGSFVHE